MQDLQIYVATVLTVYGIETVGFSSMFAKIYLALQQYLPFTVLKHLPSPLARL